MANSSQDFKNLSPFAGSKKSTAEGGNKGLFLLGVLGLIAVAALLFVAITLKAA